MRGERGFALRLLGKIRVQDGRRKRVGAAAY